MNYLKLLLSKSHHHLLKPKEDSHSVLDDAQGLFTGVLFMSLGVVFFKSAGLYTGGTMGLALALHYWTDLPLGWLMMSVNVPFYILAYFRFGKKFVVKTLLSVSLLSFFISVIPHFLVIDNVSPYFAAIMGGLLVGVGLIQLFRHRSSTGGFNILVLYLQDKYGWNAGLIQMVMDFSVITLSVFTGSGSIIVTSFLGAAIMNLSISINHRPGRYISF